MKPVLEILWKDIRDLWPFVLVVFGLQAVMAVTVVGVPAAGWGIGQYKIERF